VNILRFDYHLFGEKLRSYAATIARKRSSMQSRLVPALIVCLSIACALGSAQEKSNARLCGRVVDDSTGAPIVNANVFITSSMLGTSSDSSGRFEIRNVPPGSCELTASCIGYSLSTAKVQPLAGADLEIEMRLKPRNLSFGVVEVTAPRSPAWRNSLEAFTKLLLGSTPEVSECRILNPEVLHFFGDASGHFEAEADQELTIDNLALGYRLHLSLGSFSFDGHWVSTVWKVRYEELRASDVDQQTGWGEGRERAYAGSLRHFLVALTDGTLEENGFAMMNGASPREMLSNTWFYGLKGRDIARQSTADQWLIRFKGPLVVVNDRTQVEVGYVPGHGASTSGWRSEISTLELLKGSVLVDARGQILDQLAVRVGGDWGKDGLAKHLPLEFQPRWKR
jgi:hypothetical protein